MNTHAAQLSNSGNRLDASQSNTPAIRHIPIFVEGRDKPIINRDTISEESFERQLNNVKHTPAARTFGHQQNETTSSSFSAHRNSKEETHTSNTNDVPQVKTLPDDIDSGHQLKDDPIIKIQNIQKEVLSLMDKVENFKGNSKKDRNYLYLDEMLTQNLLKLDTIETEGSDNIKHARREAIKCINKCIEVLEAKVDASSTNNGSEVLSKTSAATAV